MPTPQARAKAASPMKMTVTWATSQKLLKMAVVLAGSSGSWETITMIRATKGAATTPRIFRP